MIHDPFEHLSDEQRRLVMTDLVENNEKNYRESLATLRSLLRRCDPLQVLSQITLHSLFVPVDKNSGVTTRDIDRSIYQFHVEVLQALVLQIDFHEISREPCEDGITSQIVQHLMTLCSAHNIRQFNVAGPDLPKSEKSVSLAQHLMRGTTQAVRNWGNHSQVKRIARELYCPFDERLLAARKFTVSDVINVFETMVVEVEARQLSHIRSLTNLFSVCRNDGCLLIKKYHEMIGLDVRESERIVESVKRERIPIEGVRAMITSNHNKQLINVYTISASELANLLHIDEDAVAAILDEYALDFGELRECEADHLHLSNPVCRKPLIRLGENKYVCTLAIAFFSFVIPCIEEVLSPFKNSVSTRRAKYLESKVAEIVKRRFPDSGIIRNLKWKEADTTYENDLLVTIDSFALIIECKSGKLSPPALRGAPDAFKREVRKLVIEPNQQSMRLKNRIESLRSQPNLLDAFTKEVKHDLSHVRKVVRVSVCLEDFGPIQSSLNQLKETGWLPEEFEPCPTMNLADFEVVFDILEHPIQILHYLMKRELLDSSREYVGHELDLLGEYLKSFLNLSDFQSGMTHFFVGRSASLNSYYDSLDAGVTLDKPKPVISPLFDSIVNQVEQNGSTRWPEIGVALSVFSPDDQDRISKLLKKLERNVRKKWKTAGHKNSMVFDPSTPSSCVLGYVMFKNENADDMRPSMEQTTRDAFASSHVQSAVVIAKNIDRDDVAYHTIELVERPEETTH